jgi:hypothetical protein
VVVPWGEGSHGNQCHSDRERLDFGREVVTESDSTSVVQALAMVADQIGA